MAAEKKSAKASAPDAATEDSASTNPIAAASVPPPLSLDVPSLVTTLVEEKEGESDASNSESIKPAKPKDLPVVPAIVCQADGDAAPAPQFCEVKPEEAVDQVDSASPAPKTPTRQAKSPERTDEVEEAFPSLPAPRGPSIFASSPSPTPSRESGCKGGVAVGAVNNVKKDLQIAEAAVAVQDL